MAPTKQKIEYFTENTCSSRVLLTLEDGIISQADFEGGCDGNLRAICQLIIGMRGKDVAQRLQGIDCGGRGTSCPDQLAKALLENLKNQS